MARRVIALRDGGPDGAVTGSYTYDAASNRATYTADGGMTTYTYDGKNRPWRAVTLFADT